MEGAIVWKCKSCSTFPQRNGKNTSEVLASVNAVTANFTFTVFIAALEPFAKWTNNSAIEKGVGGKINKIQSKFDDLELSLISVFFFISPFCSSGSSDLTKPALCLFKFPVFVASFFCLFVWAAESETNV